MDRREQLMPVAQMVTEEAPSMVVAVAVSWELALPVPMAHPEERIPEEVVIRAVVMVVAVDIIVAVVAVPAVAAVTAVARAELLTETPVVVVGHTMQVQTRPTQRALSRATDRY